MISALVVDDNVISRSGLVLLISTQADMTVFGQSSSLDGTLALLKGLQPDVIVLEGRAGGSLALQLLERQPGLPLLMISAEPDPHRVRRLVLGGARGLIARCAKPEDLFRALRSVAGGLFYFCPIIAGALAESTRLEAESAAGPLTDQQMAVLRLVAKGLTSKAAAHQLGLSPRTVERHRADILRRLECQNYIQAVEIARQRNLLSDT